MTSHTRLSAKGQVVIPKVVRDRLHWHAGADLEVVETAGGVLLRPVSRQRERIGIEEFRRRVPRHEGPPVTLDQMEQAILNEAAARFARKMRKE